MYFLCKRCNALLLSLCRHYFCDLEKTNFARLYVAFPKKAQEQVNDARLEITDQEIYDAKPESFGLRQTAVTTSDSDDHPTLDEFEAALFLESTLPDIEPFGYITIPRKKYEDETVVKINQTVEITSLEQFTRYNQIVLGTEEFRIAIRGRTDLELGALPETTIDFNKVATMKGEIFIFIFILIFLFRQEIKIKKKMNMKNKM